MLWGIKIDAERIYGRCGLWPVEFAAGKISDSRVPTEALGVLIITHLLSNTFIDYYGIWVPATPYII